MYCDKIRKKSLSFHYHLLCRYIRNGRGVIKHGVMKRCQTTFYACLHIKSHQLDGNKRDFKCTETQSARTCYSFIITFFVGIFVTTEVIFDMV